MTIERGNQLWGLRSKRGRKKIVNAKSLLEKAGEYFYWCDNNPLIRTELVKYRGSYTEATIPLNRPYTLAGFMVFLGVSQAYFRNLKKRIKDRGESDKATDEDKDLLDAIELIETAIFAQQYEGAIVGIFSGRIVSHALGMDQNNAPTSNERSLIITVRDDDTTRCMKELSERLQIE